MSPAAPAPGGATQADSPLAQSHKSWIRHLRRLLAAKLAFLILLGVNAQILLWKLTSAVMVSSLSGTLCQLHPDDTYLCPPEYLAALTADVTRLYHPYAIIAVWPAVLTWCWKLWRLRGAAVFQGPRWIHPNDRVYTATRRVLMAVSLGSLMLLAAFTVCAAAAYFRY